MITVISDAPKIETLQRRFQRELSVFFTEEIYCRVGFPGGSFEDYVHYSPELNMWIGFREADNRYWNGFGYGRPNELQGNSISGEINFPYENINRSIGGVFARENKGNILVLHRGKIGGGTSGIGKTLFMNNFRGDKVIAIDGAEEAELCLVGELKSPLFGRQVATFISEVRRIKNLVRAAEVENFEELNNYQYTAEHSGQSIVNRLGTTIVNRTHGIVVDALVSKLQQMGHNVGNDRNRDLFIHLNNQITTLFEIKTSSSSQCLYAAVGQLLVYSIPIANEIILTAVFPERLNRTVEKRLKKHGIGLLYYSWRNDEPVFNNLDEILG